MYLCCRICKHSQKHAVVWSYISIYLSSAKFLFVPGSSFQHLSNYSFFQSLWKLFRAVSHQSSVILIRSDSTLICSLYPGNVYMGEWREHNSLCKVKRIIFLTQTLNIPHTPSVKSCADDFWFCHKRLKNKGMRRYWKEKGCSTSTAILPSPF